MDIEILNADGGRITIISGVRDIEKEFPIYRDMYGAASWQEYVRPLDPPEEVLSRERNNKLAEIQTWTRQHIVSGFISSAKSTPHKYDSEEADQLTFAALYAASKSPDFAGHPIYQGQIPIRAIPEGQTEKVRLSHNAAEMQKLSDDLALHIGYCKQIGWDLQDAANAATTAEELEAINW